MISGIASSIAVIVAVANISAQETRHRADAEKKADEEASSLYAWVEPKMRLVPGAEPETVWTLQFENQTKVPTFDWTVQLVGDLADTDPSRVFTSDVAGPVIPGRSEMRIDTLPAQQLPNHLLGARVVLDFKDVRGRNWRRNTRGELQTLATDIE